MKKALSILGCLLLSIGVSAGDLPNFGLYSGFWWVQGDDSGSICEYDTSSKVMTINAGDNGVVVYRTFKEARAIPGKNELSFVDASYDIPASDLFIKLKMRFKSTHSAADITEAFTNKYRDNVREFPFKTLLYAINVEGESDPRLAFLEGAAPDDEDEVPANLVVTDYVLTDSEGNPKFENIIVRVTNDAKFRVYVDKASEGEDPVYEEVTVQGAKRSYMTLQNPDSRRYPAKMLHSFAFTGNVELTEAVYVSTNPVEKTYDTINLVFEYDPQATTVKTNDTAITSNRITVQRNSLIKIDYEKTDKKDFYKYGHVTLSGNDNAYTQAAYNESGMTLKFADPFTDDHDLTLTIPATPVFMTVGSEDVQTFDEAFALAMEREDKIVKLKNDINLDDAIASAGPSAKIADSQTIVLDLCGKTIKGLKYRTEDEAAIYNRGTLTIIDSVGGGMIIAPGYIINNNVVSEDTSNTDILALENNRAGANILIKDGIFVGKVANTAGAIQIDGGKFLNFDNSASFYLKGMPGVSLGARFSAVHEENLMGKNFWVGIEAEEGKHFVEYRLVYGEKKTIYGSVFENGYQLVATDAKPTKPAAEDIVAPGFDLDNISWHLDGSTSEYVFETSAITKSILLIGELTPKSYTISFKGSEFTDMTYKVTDALTTLPIPEDNRFWSFDGWMLDGTDKKLAAVGAFTKHPVTGEVLAQDIVFASTWTPKKVIWENSNPKYKLQGGNGCHDFTFPMSIPFEDDIPSSIKINRISLGIVNAAPKNVKRVASYMIVRDSAGNVIGTSKPSLSENVLSSGDSTKFEKIGNRPRIDYVFDDLILDVGIGYSLSFSNDGTNPCESLVRFVQTTDLKYTVIEPCKKEGLPSDYQFYAPLYEIEGEAQ